MRGPLMSGPLGSPPTLARLCQILRERPPAVVLSALWLARALGAKVPLTVLIEPDRLRSARRILQRAASVGQHLLVVAAGEQLPLLPASAGAIVIEGLAEIEDETEAVNFLADLAPLLRAGGLLIALDATKSPPVEARLAGLFLAAALVGIVQERPREGAVLTSGRPAPPAVLAARVRP